MERLSDKELEELLADQESDRAERNAAWSGEVPSQAAEAVCAFANDLAGHRKPGVLFIGAGDDGRPTGIEISDTLLTTLAALRDSGNIVPLPSVTVEKRKLAGVEMAVVTVMPSDAPPVRYRGRIWIRVGPRRGVASAQDERILNEKRRHRDLPFDVWPIAGCTLDEISRPIFEGEYLPNAFAPDVLEANERSYEERLAACRMVQTAAEPAPTVLGVLALGKSPRTWIPGAYIQFLKIGGRELDGPILDEESIDGALSTLLRRVDEKIRAHLTTAVAIDAADTEVRRSPYPALALQQILRNAVMHRTYEGTNAPIRMYWFSDRIEIYSPGGAFGLLTPENFGTPGVTDYRNPHIAEALKVLGYVQRFGVGIATAQRAMKDNANPPIEFRVEPNLVLATLRAHG